MFCILEVLNHFSSSILIMTNLLKNLLLMILLPSFQLFGQIDDVRMEEYRLGFDFEEGIYVEIDEFRKNTPSYQGRIEKVGSDLYIESDTSTDMIMVDPSKIWGFCLADNIYISYDEAYWRIINVGTLSHFSAILVTSFQTMDAFGFPVTQYSKSLQHLFLDVRTGETYALTDEQLKPFMQEEPILEHRYERTKRKKMNDLIQGVKDFNEFFPLEIPVYE